MFTTSGTRPGHFHASSWLKPASSTLKAILRMANTIQKGARLTINAYESRKMPPLWKVKSPSSVQEALIEVIILLTLTSHINIETEFCPEEEQRSSPGSVLPEIT